MAPTLAPGDILCLSRRAPQPDDIVVVEHPRYGKIVKRLDADGELHGDNMESTIGLGRLEDTQFIGTAVLRISPRGITRLRARRPYSPHA